MFYRSPITYQISKIKLVRMLRQTDEQTRQQGEDERLDEGDEYFQQADDHRAEYRQRNQKDFGDEDQSHQG